MYYPYSQHSTGLLDGSEKQSRQTLSKKTTFRDSIVSSTWVDAIVSASQKIKPTTLYAFVSGQSQFCDPVFNVSIPVVWIWIIRTCRQLKYIWIIHQLDHIWMSAHGISYLGTEFSSKKKPVEELWVSKAIIFCTWSYYCSVKGRVNCGMFWMGSFPRNMTCMNWVPDTDWQSNGRLWGADSSNRCGWTKERGESKIYCFMLGV